MHIRKSTVMLTLAFSLITGATSATAAKKVTLNFWQPWGGGILGNGMKALCDAYMKTHPNITIKLLAVDNNLATSEKFITAMAAGKPPEIILVDGPQVIQWASRNLLTPLDTYYKSSKVKAGDFWGPSWKQTLWRGKAYAVPWISDPNFPLLYNKTVFNEVGLSGPPKTLEELDLYVSKLNKTDANGKYLRFGMIPWQTYGNTNSLFTFGWAFGGEFFDDAKDKVTCNDPKVIKALDWMADYIKKYDKKKLDTFSGTFLSGAKDPMLIGKIAMSPKVADYMKTIDLAPKTFQYGWGFVPGVSGVEDKVAWLGGWTAAIPANAKNRDEAWAFLKWMCVENAGTRETLKQTGFLPSYKNTQAFASHDKKMTPWIETLKIAKHQRPVMPVTPVYFAECDLAVQSVLDGKKSPTNALNEANTKIQKELDRYLSKLKKW